MFEAVLVLTLVSFKKFIVLIVPVALACAFHLAGLPTALVFVVDSYQSTEAFHEVSLETAFIDSAIGVLDSPFSMATVLVEITLVY